MSEDDERQIVQSYMDNEGASRQSNGLEVEPDISEAFEATNAVTATKNIQVQTTHLISQWRTYPIPHSVSPRTTCAKFRSDNLLANDNLIEKLQLMEYCRIVANETATDSEFAPEFVILKQAWQLP